MAVLVLGSLGLATAFLVASSLERPQVLEFVPTRPDPQAAGAVLVGPRVYTADASDPEGWSYFDFSRGSLIEDPEPDGWDLAFRRYDIIVNGGDGFAGEGGIRNLGAVEFAGLAVAPAEGYIATEAGRDSVNAAIETWYSYGFTSHLLTPQLRVYAVRTSDGRYAKLQLLSYYCPGALPGCVTFRYVYQGGAGRTLADPVGPGADAGRGTGRP